MVAASRVFWTVDELANQLGALSAADRAPALHAVLQSFEREQAVAIPGDDTYYELRRR